MNAYYHCFYQQRSQCRSGVEELTASFRGMENQAFSFTPYVVSSIFKDGNLAICISLKKAHTSPVPPSPWTYPKKILRAVPQNVNVRMLTHSRTIYNQKQAGWHQVLVFWNLAWTCNAILVVENDTAWEQLLGRQLKLVRSMYLP